jgi:hypothetical protein
MSHELGKAFIIAAILSVTVDILLKQRLISEIKENVFKAAMGYLFPEEIRGEVKWFYNFPLIAQPRTHHFAITRIDGTDYVEVLSSDNATIRNISNKVAPIEVQIHADQWGVENRPTDLVELGYRYKGKRVESTKQNPKKVQHENQSVQWTFGEIELAPKGNDGDNIDVWRKIKETKRINDNVWWVAIWPSVNPQIQIVAPPGFGCQVDYVGRVERESLVEYEKGAFRLSGTILPSQVLIVKWWPKGEDEKAKPRIPQIR